MHVMMQHNYIDHTYAVTQGNRYTEAREGLPTMCRILIVYFFSVGRVYSYSPLVGWTNANTRVMVAFIAYLVIEATTLTRKTLYY